MILRFLFPEGKTKTLTFSYDDGPPEDRRLVSLLNEFDLKGTFHLNSRKLNTPGEWVQASEARALYAGHEISCHGKTHPFEEQIPLASMIEDIRDDRIALEQVAGYPVYGMSYPFGTYDSDVLRALQSLGIVYSRTTKSTGGSTLPTDYLQWHPSAHHNGDILQLGDAFLKNPWGLRCLYIWGHSYEFPRDQSWGIMEDFCKKMARNPQIWYATNIEIYEYMQACKRLIVAMDGHLVRNPSFIPVWIADANGQQHQVEGGTTIEING